MYEFTSVVSDGPESDIAKTAQLQPLGGFDRLSVAGFSESDIANFRRQFHSQSASSYLDTDFDTEEECVFILPICTICTIGAVGLQTTNTLEHWKSDELIHLTLLAWHHHIRILLHTRAAFWDSGTEHELTGSVVFS
jgi:DUF2407 C-terminal domain